MLRINGPRFKLPTIFGELCKRHRTCSSWHVKYRLSTVGFVLKASASRHIPALDAATTLML